MNTKSIVCLLLTALTGFAFSESVDFSRVAGKVRHELHSSGFGPLICSCPPSAIADVKAMNFLNARTHDWALINPGQRVCDYFHIFPLLHLDAKDPKNYVFAPTDYLLKRTREETGLGIFFRLGTSIEHSGPTVHFNARIPEDFEKVAESFAGTVRHYNHGWANGFQWGIQYWELWNEPDGHNNMWCDPDPNENGDDKRCQKFTRFFVTALKRLKSEFPEIKVGGPALCSMKADYFTELFRACKEAGVTPDFISWHYYGNNPDAMVASADKARALCDSFGFTQCELILNEWHYLGCSWKDLRDPSPAMKKRIWSGPAAHNGIDSACFTLASLAKFQTSKLNQAYYYGCKHDGNWGYKGADAKKFKVWYALKLFGEIVKETPVLCVPSFSEKLVLFPTKSEDYKTKRLLVVDYRSGQSEIRVDVANAGAVQSALLLDHTHDATPCEVKFENGQLLLQKPDTNSAAFSITFGEEK
ncbi:MAG: hypothetical protein IJR99_00020 [Kiritimatiellae bacterium]|nr:hypothetical protein [Kiritimatiellia bacterium]